MGQQFELQKVFLSVSDLIKAAPVRSDVEEKTDGILSITNKRIVFSANKGAFDKKLSAISSVTPHKMDTLLSNLGITNIR